MLSTLARRRSENSVVGSVQKRKRLMVYSFFKDRWRSNIYTDAYVPGSRRRRCLPAKQRPTNSSWGKALRTGDLPFM